MSSMQREKGKRGEREVVELVRAAGWTAKRTWETAQGANPECDVLLGATNPTIPFQVKRRRSYKALYEALHKVRGVFLRGDGGEWLVLVRAKDYLKIVDNLV